MISKKIILVLGLMLQYNSFATDKLISAPTGNLILDAGSSSAVKINKTLQVDSVKNLAGTDILVGLVPTGAILPYTGSTAPTGWVLAYGQEVSQTGTYANLFAVIGSTYCTTDHGGTCSGGNFRIPDMRGRGSFGKDNMGGSAANRITSAKTIDGTILGKAGGNQSYTPTGTASTTMSIPAHYHGVGAGSSLSATGQTLGSTPVSLTSGVVNVSGAKNQFNHDHQTYTLSTGGFNPALFNSNNTSGTVTGYTSVSQVANKDFGTETFSASGSVSGTTNISHTHAASAVTGTIGLVTGGQDGNTSFSASGSSVFTGTEGSNLPPLVIVNYIIKL